MTKTSKLRRNRSAGRLLLCYRMFQIEANEPTEESYKRCQIMFACSSLNHSHPNNPEEIIATKSESAVAPISSLRNLKVHIGHVLTRTKTF